jgi:putative flippase GtrA
MTFDADTTQMPRKTRRELTRFLKFSIVGAIGFLIDIGTFNLLTNLIGMASVLAGVISAALAITSNFIWNRYWTYPDSRSKPVTQQAVQFTFVSVLGIGIRVLIFLFIEDDMIRLAGNLLQAIPGSVTSAYFPGGESQAVALGQNLTLILAVVVVLFWNFIVNRFWTYSDAD